MSRFEDRLWSELVEQHGAVLAGQPSLGLLPGAAPLRGAVPQRRPLATIGVAVAAVVAAIVIGLSTGGSGPAPAYAVTRNPDGTVSVTIQELAAAQSASEALARMGLPVRAAAAEESCHTDPRQYRMVPEPQANPQPIFSPFLSAGVNGVRINPTRIPAGDTLLLGVREAAPKTILLEVSLYRGAAPPCLPLPPTG
jgi:hypothetical protein